MPEKFETFRDPTLSMFQSLMDDVARKITEPPKAVGPKTRSLKRPDSSLRSIATDIALRETGQKPAGSGPATRSLGGTSKFCAELALLYMKALATGNEDYRAAVNAKYTGSTCDAAWVNTLKEYHAYFGAGGLRQIPYVSPSTIGQQIIPMKSGARVALVADWGTGAQPALQVLGAIRELEPDVLIHLGDIYYSGTPKECEENFLTPINGTLRANRNCNVYTLSGNHDMYCGGVGYYDLISRLNGDPFRQNASFFCLRADDESWQFLAMDTGLHDHTPYSVSDVTTWIEDDELNWLCDRMQEFNGQTILLSHHQLFSAFSAIGPEKDGTRSPLNPKLMKAFETLAAKGKIAGWFWGHEHSLTIYQEFAGLQRGRCIGNGAIPVPDLQDIYEPVAGLPDAPKIVSNTMVATTGGVWNNGFAVLKLSNVSCDASYFQVSNGECKLVYVESF
ncbi:metallophosphoesterase family protein [Rhizobium leguminosarum]|uniref:metallophosphoesterase family protein n=1 Tax=Rhizobium leguminosarum TaxID=384 RepID=UPI001031A925|nr:metallophosphoesterase [Rhizobium leguminosarum]TAY71254.1 metallophosphoesterase [Rhizobium leguminosarum]TAY71511.1 metallophosphoesterase [Rhizobium leguminosarum]